MRSPLKLFPSFSPFPSSPFITDTLVFVPCHPLMGSSAAVAAYRPSLGLLHFPLSLFTLPPSLCALVKISSVPRSIFSSSLLLPVPSPPPRSFASSPLLLPLPLHGPGYGLNMTAIPLKRGGIIIIIRAHQQQAAPWTNLTNTERGDAAETPTHPPTPTPGLLRLNLKGKNGWQCWGGGEGEGGGSLAQQAQCQPVPFNCQCEAVAPVPV